MREKLNESPIAQVALVAVLVVVGVVLFMRVSGGGEEEGEEAGAGPTVATVNGATAVGDTPGEAVEGAIANLEAGAGAAPSGEMPSSLPAPPPPRKLTVAYDSGRTVVLLVSHDGGIDDRLVEDAATRLEAMPGVALIHVPAREIARYAAITVGLEVNRVPALIVMRPKQLSGGIPQASVEYGFQTPETIVQAVRDASYAGPEETYHPD